VRFLRRRPKGGPERSLDELVADAKELVETLTPALGADEDWIPTLLVSGRSGTVQYALQLEPRS
jgi:hypothetical protein